MRARVMLIAAATVACTIDNPAYDDDDPVAGSETSAATTKPETTSSTSGDGDGDPTAGDGDGDPTTGDGDGDPTTGDGDGDGEPTTGDGDGDPTTGDGDGDGDGDPVDPLCDPGEQLDMFGPFLASSLGFVDATSFAPGFGAAPEECHMFVICAASQALCDGEGPYLVKGYSNAAVYVGDGNIFEPEALKIEFHPGPMPCGEPLMLDPSQFFIASYWDGDWADLAIHLPCYESYGVPLYIAADGSTFWDAQLSEPAALVN